MTVKEFWESNEYLAVHCDTEEKANKLLKKFDELGKVWSNGNGYLTRNYWEYYKEKTCYTNRGRYDSKEYYENELLYYKVIKFDDLEDFKADLEDFKAEVKSKLLYKHVMLADRVEKLKRRLAKKTKVITASEDAFVKLKAQMPEEVEHLTEFEDIIKKLYLEHFALRKEINDAECEMIKVEEKLRAHIK